MRFGSYATASTRAVPKRALRRWPRELGLAICAAPPAYPTESWFTMADGSEKAACYIYSDPVK